MQWFGHKIITDEEIIDKYLLYHMNITIERNTDTTNTINTTSSSSTIVNSIIMNIHSTNTQSMNTGLLLNELFEYYRNSKESLARRNILSNKHVKYESAKIKLLDSLTSINYMLLVTIPNDDNMKDNYKVCYICYVYINVLMYNYMYCVYMLFILKLL